MLAPDLRRHAYCAATPMQHLGVGFFAAAALLLSSACGGVYDRAQRDVQLMRDAIKVADQTPITAEDLNVLPDPVANYLRLAGVVGQPQVRSARLQQRGFFRGDAEQDWMPMTAVQYISVDPPGFVWVAKIAKGPFVVDGRDRYWQGQGNMFIQMGPVTIADADDEHIAQAAAVRYFIELLWVPSAFLDDSIKWQAVDAHTAVALMQWQHGEIEASFEFGDDGMVKKIRTLRYAGDAQNGYSLEPYEGRLQGYARRGAFVIPTQATAVWLNDDKPFAYWRSDEIFDVAYDQKLEWIDVPQP